MQKSVLTRLIDKYSLGGVIEAVKLTANASGVHVHFATDSHSCMGFVSTTNATLDNGDYCIFDTPKLKQMLGVVSDEIDVCVERNTTGQPIAFILHDDVTRAKFVLSDPMVIPKVPVMKNTPIDIEVMAKLDQRFITTFMRAKSALADVDTFSVVSDGQRASIVLGYAEEINRNSVTIALDATRCLPLVKPLSFPASEFREVLAANKEMLGAEFWASSKRIAHVRFQLADFEAEYFLVQKNH